MAKLDLTRTQMEILMYLIKFKDKNVSGSDIEKFFNLKNPTVTGILNRLEDKGFITRAVSSRDARIKYIKATDKAVAIEKETTKIMNEVQKKLFNNISKEDILITNILLDKLLNNAQQCVI